MSRTGRVVNWIVIVGLAVAALALLFAPPAAASIPEGDCKTYYHHRGYIPGHYDFAVFYERGYDTRVEYTNGEDIYVRPPKGRHSWDRVDKCKFIVTTTTIVVTTSTLPPTTTTLPPSTTTVVETTTTSVVESTTTTPPPSTTTTPPSSTTTTPEVTTTTKVVTTTAPPSTSTTEVCEWPDCLPATGTNGETKALIALTLIGIGILITIAARDRGKG